MDETSAASFDELGPYISDLIHRIIAGEDWGSYGIVESYNELSHKASVRLYPSNLLSDELPVLSPFQGYSHKLRVGEQVWVLLERGKPLIVAGTVYRQTDPIPQRAMVIEDDVSVIGDINSTGLRFERIIALPPAIASQRGRVVFYAPVADGYSGTPDGLYMCMQGTTGSLSWVLVKGAP